MDEEVSSDLYTIRDVTENKTIALHGKDKVFLIGKPRPSLL